jgi:hypothetical protein
VGPGKGHNFPMLSIAVRSFEASDLPWAEALIGGDFAGRLQVRMGTVVDALAGPGFVAGTGCVAI